LLRRYVLNTQPTSKNVTRRPGAALRGEEPGEKSLASKAGVVVGLFRFNKTPLEGYTPESINGWNMSSRSFGLESYSFLENG